jgi:hypothetical protein
VKIWCGDTRGLEFLGGNQVKGAGPLVGGATLKIETLPGLEETSCGVESTRASLQGFESPSPHQFSATTFRVSALAKFLVQESMFVFQLNAKT